MAKKITDENGNVYKMKKPFYKKVWFWVLAIIVIGVAANGLSGDSENGGKKVNKIENKTGTKETEKVKFYSVGDEVKVGDATYKLNSVELTDERNEFDDTKPEKVVKIQYTMQNDSKEDLPVGMDLSVYNADDTKAETYPNDNTMGSVAAGKKMEVTQHYGLNDSGEIELQFAPAISLEDTANFKAKV